MSDLSHLALLDVDPVRVYKTLRRAGLNPWPPVPYGPAGIKVVLGDWAAGSVIVSQAEIDGVQWIHASIALNTRMPSYEDLTMLKQAVFGDRREAYQVFPSKSRHISIHHHALHLWGRADGRPVLPDFGAEGTI